MSASGRGGGAPSSSSTSRSGSSLHRPRSLYDIEGDLAAFAETPRIRTPGLADRLPPLPRPASPSPFGHLPRETSDFGSLARGTQPRQSTQGDFRPFGPLPSLFSSLQGGAGPTLPALAISNIPFPQGRGRGRGRGSSPSLPRLSDLNLGDLDMSMTPSAQASLLPPVPDLTQGGLPSLRRRPSAVGQERLPEPLGLDASFPVTPSLSRSSSTRPARGGLPSLSANASLQSLSDPFRRPPSPFQPQRSLRRRTSGHLSLSDDAMQDDLGFDDPTAAGRSGLGDSRGIPQTEQSRRSASPAAHRPLSLLDPPSFGYPAEGGYYDPYDVGCLSHPSSLPPRASSPQLRGSSNMLTDLPDLSSLPPLPFTAPVSSASHPSLARYASFTDFRTPLTGGMSGLPRGESTGSVGISNSSSGSGSTSSQYTCSDCGTVWARKADFDRHVRTHTGEKPFQCDLCDKGYARKDALLRHQRTVHASTLEATRYTG